MHNMNIISKFMPSYHVADLDPNENKKIVRLSKSPISIAFREMQESLEKEGLYETRMTFYYGEAIKLLILFGISLYILINNPNSWKHITGSAVIMALFWQQLAFVAHDIGHNGVTHNMAIDNKIGVVIGNFLTGISMGWWKHSHYIHHVVPNDPSKDPDIQLFPFIAASGQFFKDGPLYSTYHKRYLLVDAVAKVLMPIQHYMFYIILLFGRFNLFSNSFIFLNTVPNVPNWHLECFGILTYWIWFSKLMSIMPEWKMIAWYVSVSHVLTFILHIQIMLSHYSMEVGTAYYENEEAFIETQLRATLDIKCPTYMDWFHGGLQFQAIHHLFPRLPRHNLRVIQPRVVALCKKFDIPYSTLPFFDANWVVVDTLKQVACDLVEYLEKGGNTAVKEKSN